MPRRAAGARLWPKPAEHNADGSLRKRAVWIIRDGKLSANTGCPVQPELPDRGRGAAEPALADYLTKKHNPARDEDRALGEILVTDVLAVYGEDVAPKHARPEKTAARLLQLGAWWQGKTVAEVNGKSVRAYGTWRKKTAWRSAKPDSTGKRPRTVGDAGVRRELEDLQSALNHYLREGHMRAIVKVPLPEKSEAKDRYLERSEAARLLWGMYRCRESMTIRASIPARAGEVVGSRKRPHAHLARFLLVGIYTGTRASAICSAAFERAEGRSWIDLDRGVFHRLAQGQKKTKKRQPPVRLPKRLLAHIRRWSAMPRKDGTMPEHVVEFRGRAIGEVNKGFAVAVANAGLGPDVTPHTLRHTCATWMMQAGVDMWQAAEFLGMTVAILESTYGHHRPDFQEEASGALNKGARREQPAIDIEDAFSRRRAA